jgi:hypothetical protein
MSDTPEEANVEPVTTEPEVLYDPDTDDLQDDDAPADEILDGDFVETEVQDPDGSDS